MSVASIADALRARGRAAVDLVAGAFGARLRAAFARRPVCALVAAVVAAATIGLTDSGRYLDRVLMLDPIMRLRHAFGMEAQLDEDLRIVLFDDRSLDHVGRHLTFAEWYSIARMLFDRGYERVYLLGLFGERMAIGNLPERHTRGHLVLGATVYPAAGNPRTLGQARIPRHLVPAASEARRGLAAAEQIFMPDAAALRYADSLGALNLLSDFAMPVGYALGEDAVLPNFALSGIDTDWREGRPRLREALVPSAFGSELQADLLAVAPVFRSGVTVSTLMEPSGVLRASLARSAAKKLEGGRVAVLLPEAYTGARFVDTPVGKMPAFMLPLSLLSGVATKRFLWTMPLYDSALIAAVLWAALISTVQRFRVAVALSVCVLGSLGLVATWLVNRFGMLTPGVQVAAVILAGLLATIAHRLLIEVAHRTRLARDLDLGRSVQTLLLPASGASADLCGRWRYQLVYEPYGAMSGDWVQLHQSADPRHPWVLLAVGDVTGKGPGAALNAAVIASIFAEQERRWEGGEPDIEKLVTHLNATIHRTFRGHQMSTLSMALVKPGSTLLWSFAAPAWLKVAADGTATFLKAPRGDNLGFKPQFNVPRALLVELAPGDTLLAFTDGVVDHPSSRLNLLRIARPPRLRPDDALDVFVHSFSELAREAGEGLVLDDDFTIFALRTLESGSAHGDADASPPQVIQAGGT